MFSGAVVMAILKSPPPVPPLASVTPAVKANWPGVFGVPEMAPPEARVRPSGRFPPLREKVYGAVPPVATIRPV